MSIALASRIAARGATMASAMAAERGDSWFGEAIASGAPAARALRPIAAIRPRCLRRSRIFRLSSIASSLRLKHRHGLSSARLTTRSSRCTIARAA
jgi:hypothetical protein